MISLIVTTAPGREENLNACLKSIAHQTVTPAEVIVTDDGETGGQVVGSWVSTLPIHYLSRPNDRCISRSRNRAVAHASQEHLVFVDGDVLLNPEALKSYQAHIQEFPRALLGGYFGNEFAYTSASAFDKSREINYIDKRFEACSSERFYPFSRLLSEPAFFCWGGNFSISRAQYLSLEGFNEDITGWGAEDIDFSLRAIAAGIEIHFCVDTWGEHQVHSRKSFYHQKNQTEMQRSKQVLQASHPPIHYPVRVIGQTEQTKDLHHKLTTFYTQQDPEVTPSLKAKLTQPNAMLVSRFLSEGQLELGCAFSK